MNRRSKDNRSRYRKAAIYDLLAVALLMALMAALGAIVFFSIPQAKAEPDSEVVAFAAHYATEVCSTLDMFPTVDGVTGVLEAVVDEGLTPYQSGQAVAMSVYEACPRHARLLELFVARYGEKVFA